MRDDPLQLDKLIEPVIRGLGLELWGYEYRAHKQSALLRVFIDSDEGVTLDDCSLVSEQLSALLDVEDPIQVPYTLEVSSPGLDRVLFKPEHFERYAGHKVKIRLKWPVEGRRNVSGQLAGVRDDRVVVTLDTDEFLVPVDAIDRARLVVDV